MFKILLCIILVIAYYLLIRFGVELRKYTKEKKPAGEIILYFIFGILLTVGVCAGWYHIGYSNCKASMVISE